MELTLASFHSHSATGELLLGQGELFHLFLAIWQLGLWQTYTAFVLAQFSVGAKMQNG